MSKVKTKGQIWDEVKNLLTDFGHEDDDLFKGLQNLLEPKKSGRGSRPENRIIDGKEFYFCRFTGRFWSSDDMIYQNEEKKDQKKDKGYSKIGISIWNKGQKEIKKLKDDLFNELMSEKPDTKKLETMKKEIGEIDSGNLGNQPEWLSQFLTEDQKKMVETDSVE